MDRWIAGFLQVGAAALFFFAGAQVAAVDDAFVLLCVPAVASGVAGLLLWGRGTRASLAAREEPVALPGQVARVEELVASLEDDVAQLREDREFYGALYSGRSSKPEIGA